MLSEIPDISIIIVNYRVKDYVILLLKSLQKAQKNLKIEIFVVDNNSGDDSVGYIKIRFPDIQIIANETNKGFGKANNQALSKVNGKYTFLINPDTVVTEDSLVLMKNYMDSNDDCGVAGFRMLNPDGSFARECKRSIPDLRSAVFRVLGLDVLFPKNKIIGKRYLGWLPEYEINNVPVISGASMFWRTDLLKELKGFDEDFFMYGEDDELCFRVKKTKYDVRYVPISTILHFKGESEREINFRYLKKVNEGLLLFFQKHFKERYNRLSLWLISLAYQIRIFVLFIILSFKKNKFENANKKKSLIVITDLENNSLEHQLKQKEFPYSIISGSLESKEIIDQIITSQIKYKGKAKVVFDINSLTFKEIFTVMEKLRSRKIDFWFLSKGEKKMIGKANIIELNK